MHKLSAFGLAATRVLLLSLSSLGQFFPTHSEAAQRIIMPSHRLVGATRFPPSTDGVTERLERKHALLRQGHSRSVGECVAPGENA